MELSVLERLTLLSLLPHEGSFRNMKIVRTLRESLSFDEDAEKFGLQETETGDGRKSFQWNHKVEQTAEIEVGERAVELIADTLKALDKADKLPEQAVTLYEKFVEK